MFGFAFAPKYWAKCDGAILPVNQNVALFALLGAQYGGDSRTTFGLPDLRGRAILGAGIGTDGMRYPQGVSGAGGAETVTLTAANLPYHTHSVVACANPATQNSPKNNFIAEVMTTASGGVSVNTYAPPPTTGSGAALVPQSAAVVSTNGGGGAHNNMQPFSVVNYCISTSGVYPTRG
ncbi:MAG: phage tail protein [Magnetospirillum sp.]|nr:phage tail protein [Magnetospirillum sp.]